MKIETVFGVLPTFIVEKDFKNTNIGGQCKYICFIEVEDLEDRITIEHEKQHARDNYTLIIVPAFVLWMSTFIAPLVTFVLSLFYLSYVIFNSYTSQGVYYNEIRAYKKSALEFSKKYDVSYDLACEHYARIIINSGLYGSHAKKLGFDRIKKDLID